MQPRPLLDIGRARVVRGRGLYITLPLAERVRAARGVKQAVVKVTGYSRGKGAVKGNLEYISRDGKLPLETDQGAVLLGREEQRELVKTWAADFEPRKNGRDTAKLVFSMPHGSDPEALRKAVRTTGARAFPGHEWVFAVHQDKDHPHAHMAVKMRGREGKQLRIDPPDLFRIRELFAEAAREQGVELAASPRAARGVGQKGMRRAIRKLRDKKIVPNVWKEAYREALHERDLPEKPWEKAMSERNKLEREAYRKGAAELRRTAEKLAQEKVREQMLKDAQLLERYAEVMPRAKSKRQRWIENEKQRVEQLRREKAQKQDRDMGMER